MDEQLKLGKNALVLSIMTLLTVFTWIGFEVYRTYTQPTVPKIIKELIQPLNPTINEIVLIEIEKKYQPSEEELNIITAPLPSPSLELETEEEVTPSQIATEGGTLE